MKVVIWGYPTNAHTHFYTHEALYKAFKHLEYDTYWFHDDGYPEDFDWDDCCLLYTSPSPRDVEESRMPSSA